MSNATKVFQKFQTSTLKEEITVCAGDVSKVLGLNL